jgi:hypothetical protein
VIGDYDEIQCKYFKNFASPKRYDEYLD